MFNFNLLSRIGLTIYVVFLIMFFCFIYIIPHKKSKKERQELEDKYWKTSDKNSLISIVINKTKSYNYSSLLEKLISYDLFKDDSIKILLDQFDYQNIRENLEINTDIRRPSEEKIKEYIEYILRNNREIDQFLATLFIEKITKNIEEGELIEKEHETLVKAYGNDDDVKLHKAEKEEEDEEIPDSTLMDLYKNNLAEDIEDE